MPEISYNIAVDQLTLTSERKRGDAHLVELFCELTMGGVGRCVLIVAPGSFQLPGLQTAAKVSLDAGDGPEDVFSGTVTAVGGGATEIRIEAHDSLYSLGRMGFAQAYEGVKAGDIAREILQKAGAKLGNIEPGPAFASYVLHFGPSALQHLRRLASSCGLDIFCHGNGQVHVCGPATIGEKHVFAVDESVLSLDLFHAISAHDGFEVWGEGASSTKGSKRSHWLATELAGVSGRAAIHPKGHVQKGSQVTNTLWSRQGSLRTGEAAAAVAEGIASARASRRIRGEIEVLGTPKIQPGDLVELDGLPEEHTAKDLLEGATLRARTVRHTLTTSRGFLTQVEF